MKFNGNVIIYGDDPTCHTGFGKVVDHLVDAVLTMGYRPIVVGLKYELSSDYKVTKINAIAKDDDKNGWTTLAKAIKEYNAKIVISVGDPWDIQGIYSIRKEMKFVWISYTPVEAKPYPSWILISRQPTQYLDVNTMTSSIDHIVTFTDFGTEALEELIQKNNQHRKTMISSRISRIYFGVDLDFYKPSGKLDARKRLGGIFGTDDLLFTTIKTNTARAGFDTLLDAWCKYMDTVERTDPKLYERSKLYIHTDVKGSGYMILDMIKHSNLKNQKSIVLDTSITLGKGQPAERVRDIYNSTDIFLSTTRGEGFGFPIAEAMACGVPCIIPDYAGPAEYSKDASIKIPIVASFQPEFSSTRFGIVDYKTMAKEMLLLARNANKRKDLSLRSLKVISRYTWDRFETEWAEVINRAITQVDDMHISSIELEYI